jgi:hypothetical protein
MEEYIMGTNLPDNFADGQELEASELNKMLVARTNSMLPIDNTTRNETDLAGGLGSATKRYTEAHIDNIKIDGNTMSSTDTDGDINLTPNGAGRVKISKLLGAYGSTVTITTSDSTGGTFDTDFTATVDCVMVVQKIDYTSAGVGGSQSHQIKFANSGTPTDIYYTVAYSGASSVTTYTGLNFIMQKGSVIRFTATHSTPTLTTGVVSYKIQSIGV